MHGPDFPIGQKLSFLFGAMQVNAAFQGTYDTWRKARKREHTPKRKLYHTQFALSEDRRSWNDRGM